jgi:hypothetical protein
MQRWPERFDDDGSWVMFDDSIPSFHSSWETAHNHLRLIQNSPHNTPLTQLPTWSFIAAGHKCDPASRRSLELLDEQIACH